MNRSESIDGHAIAGLHPSAIRDHSALLELFRNAQTNRIQFSRGLNRRVDLETALIIDVDSQIISFKTSGFRRHARRQIFLNFEAGGLPYFFSSDTVGRFDGDILRVAFPESVYFAERRDRKRLRPNTLARDISLIVDGEHLVSARVEDVSPGGLGISVPTNLWNEKWHNVRLIYSEYEKPEGITYASVRSQHKGKETGWTRIGLIERADSSHAPIEPEISNTLRIAPTNSEVIRPVSPKPLNARAPTEVVSFPDRNGKRISGYLDCAGEATGGTCVVLHTGWGETKESLLPLALTIVETFRAHSEPVSVLRIDGVNQKGESFKDPECRFQGREYHNFVFSQSVDDLDASLDYIQCRAKPQSTIIVSQSVASLAARKLLSQDPKRRVDAWVCIAGSPDLQSMSRTISGGIDFAVGFENGIRFGFQELLGIVVHADRLMADAIKIGVLHIDSARRDFLNIDIPISWFHGQFDAWVDFDRVKDVLSYGTRENRRLIVIPAAHRLGWSKGASDAFLSVSAEVARLATRRNLQPVRPHQTDLTTQRSYERSRRPRLTTNLRKFWKDYLLGRDGSIGIELMTACDPYASLMSDQIEMISPEHGDRILDVGCGTGSLATELAASKSFDNSRSTVVGLDHVPDALKRARLRASQAGVARAVNHLWLAGDLDTIAGATIVPFDDKTFDAVLASLVISYLERPKSFLAEVFRLVRPGGKVVVSSLVKDADISRLYVESITELQLSVGAPRLPGESQTKLNSVARNFLNDAARILDLEADGSFTFWEPEELATLLESAGFIQVETKTSFGNPAQAAIAVGTRPR